MKRIPAACALVAFACSAAEPDDALVRAMRDELERAKTLKLETLDRPYYVEYAVDDHESYTQSASLGALYAPVHARFRIPRVRVRVGAAEFDNTDYVFSDYYSGSRYDPDQLSFDNDYYVLRRALWLASDRAYKGAVEAIARKRAALRNVTQQESLPDFWKAEPVNKMLPLSAPLAGTADWAERLKALSSVFGNHPEINSSNVTFEQSRTTFYLHNSEGTSVRLPEVMSRVTVRASGQASDGMNVRDGVSLLAVPGVKLDDAKLRGMTETIAANVKALTAAPAGENYNGPILFDGVAAAQIFAEVLGPNLALPRRPVNEPSRPAPFLPSELEGRIGSRVLPDFLEVIDDSLQQNYDGKPLAGYYPIDEEGIIPSPVKLIEKGRAKNFLLTRQPVRGFQASNGHARVPGPYGASQAMIGNLFINASESVKAADLKARLLQMIRDQNKPFGMIIRKMDFPSTAPNDELRRLMMASGQRGSARPVSAPVLAYRIYPDGREELVRGLRFRGLSVRSLRDILAVSDERYVFEFLNTPAPFALGGGGYVAAASVIAPAFLLEEVELERPQEELPKLPVAPPPPLTISAR